MSRTPDYIVRDINRKLADDISSRVKMSASLTDDPRDAMMAAITAAGAAIGYAAGYSDLILREAGDVLEPEKQVDLMWAILRPIALATLGGSDADFRQLLSHCRTYPESNP